MESYLKCFASKNPKWKNWLQWVEIWHNLAFHTSVGMTPFKAVYGCDPPPLIPYYSNEKDPPKFARLLPCRDKILQQL